MFKLKKKLKRDPNGRYLGVHFHNPENRVNIKIIHYDPESNLYDRTYDTSMGDECNDPAWEKYSEFEITEKLNSGDWIIIPDKGIDDPNSVDDRCD